MHLTWSLYAIAGGILIRQALTDVVDRKPQPIIIDTDIFSDVDDVGALVVANNLHSCGFAGLLGVAVNTHSKYGALATSVINTYYGNEDVSIAAIRPLTDDVFIDSWAFLRSEYASKLAQNWPRDLEYATDTPTPLRMYRSLLALADVNSVNIISIGFLTNLADLLRSEADEISRLSGLELIRSKVRELIVMGGQYPSGWEYNFSEDGQSTKYVLEHWPETVPITFSGVELGGEIYSGQTLREDLPYDSPLRAAYEWYMGRCSTTQKSWDPVTALYGVFGLDGYEQLGLGELFAYANEDGYNSFITLDGTNQWVNTTRMQNQHWLKLADGVSNEDVAEVLSSLYSHDPADSTCSWDSGDLVEQS